MVTKGTGREGPSCPAARAGTLWTSASVAPLEAMIWTQSGLTAIIVQLDASPSAAITTAGPKPPLLKF